MNDDEMTRLFDNGYVATEHVQPDPAWDEICNFVSYAGHCTSKRPCQHHSLVGWETDDWLVCAVCAWEEDRRHRRE